MRCFESHKVVALDDMRKDGARITVHKPLECDIHAGENVIYNCTVCNVTACGECVKNDHKGHQSEGILDSEVRVRQEIETLLLKSKERIEQLSRASTNLQNNMEELAHQRSNAKDLVNESYQSYKAVLEKCKNDALNKLTSLYHERELIIMEETDELGKTINNLEDATKFTARLLENGTIPEMMYLRKIVSTRLSSLNNKVPKVEKCLSVDFRSDFAKFEETVKDHFGTFLTETDTISKRSTPLSIVADLPPLTINGVSTTGSPIITNGCNGVTVANTSPISMSASIQSSFEGDISSNLHNFAITPSPPLQHVNSTALQGFSSIAEYNIAQLATLAETTSSAATSPTPATGAFNLADLLNNDTAYKNLASLAKLGLTANGKF